MNTSYHPGSTTELADVLYEMAGRQTTLRVIGRDSKAGWGQPVNAEQTLSVDGLSGILDYQPAELFMTAQAGTPVKEINAALAEHHQQLAFEPSPGTPGNCRSEISASIGGVFATNLAGPRRHICGGARDHLLGFEAVNGLGQVVKAGGTVVKNVTGYDMCRLISGSFGTLAVMSTLSFRVMPIAHRRITLALTDINTSTALRKMGELAASQLQPSGLCWLAPSPLSQPLPELQRNPGSGILLIRLEGLAGGTMDRASRMRHELGDHDPIVVLDQEASDRLWRSLRDLDELKREEDDDILIRVSVAPGNAPDLAKVLATYPNCHWVADHGGATFWVRVAMTQALRVLASIRVILSDLGGVLTVVDTPITGAQNLSQFGPLDSVNARLNGQLKSTLDPSNILNPGKLGSVVARADSI